jgi:hypothetical protein
MKTNIVLLLVLCLFLTLSCQFLPFEVGGDAKRTLGEEVKTYPVTLKGSATVSTPYDAATCVRQGSATFVAGDDSTCVLNVSFPMTYTDIQGKCVDNGDTQAWLLSGTFAKGYQVCRFETCNDNEAYYASGFIRFYPTSTDSATVRCSLAERNKLEVTIELPPLAP